MSVDSLLDSAFTTLLGKARQEFEAERPAPRTANMGFEWGGGGAALVATATDPLIVEVPFDSGVVWAHMYALDGAGEYAAVTASVELRIRQTGGAGGSSFLYGTGSVPALTSQGFADLDLTGWRRNLVIGDVVTARLRTLTGTANIVAVIIQIRSSDVPIGVSTLVDGSGNTFTDNSGDPFVFRS